MVGWKLIEKVGVYSLALHTVFKFGPKLKKSDNQPYVINSMHRKVSVKFYGTLDVFPRQTTYYACYVNTKEPFASLILQTFKQHLLVHEKKCD